jgi:hypothetical protein
MDGVIATNTTVSRAAASRPGERRTGGRPFRRAAAGDVDRGVKKLSLAGR